MRKIDKGLLRHLIEVEELTHSVVAARFQCSLSSVQRMCARMGLKTQSRGARRGARHRCWKGGRVLVGRYWYIYAPDHPNATKAGYVAEHRLVIEQTLGRFLRRTEVVHHRDGDPQNNAPQNLEAFSTNADHLRHELQGRVPNWTPDGQERIRQGVRKAAAIHRKTKTDDDLRLLSTAHLPSSTDSTREGPAS